MHITVTKVYWLYKTTKLLLHVDADPAVADAGRHNLPSTRRRCASSRVGPLSSSDCFGTAIRGNAGPFTSESESARLSLSSLLTCSPKKFVLSEGLQRARHVDSAVVATIFTGGHARCVLATAPPWTPCFLDSLVGGVSQGLGQVWVRSWLLARGGTRGSTPCKF